MRDPRSRLLSGYINKFIRDKNSIFLAREGADIVRHSNREPDKRGLKYYQITFAEFLSFMFFQNGRLRHDPHFENAASLCSPCTIKYDFIGKQETFNEDSNFLFSNIFKKVIKTPKTRHATHSGQEETEKAFLKLPDHLRKLVVEQYAIDAEIFGYDIHGNH